MIEKLLIQQAALCWLKLNLVELSYSNTMKQSITLTLGVFNEASLRHILKSYFEYYEHSRTHLALEKDAPELRAIQLEKLV